MKFGVVPGHAGNAKAVARSKRRVGAQRAYPGKVWLHTNLEKVESLEKGVAREIDSTFSRLMPVVLCDQGRRSCANPLLYDHNAFGVAKTAMPFGWLYRKSGNERSARSRQ